MALSGQHVLVLRALGLGDLLTAVPALRSLRTHLGRAHITLAAPLPLAELLPLIGAVDELLPVSGLRGRLPVTEPDVAVNLHGKGPESIQKLLTSKPRALLTHTHPEVPEVRGPRWEQDQHEVHRWCRLLQWYGIEADPADLLLRAPAERVHPGAVVVHPGASRTARCWPPERFAEISSWLADRGLPVLISGSPAERGLAELVAALGGLPKSAVVAGKTSLHELAALVCRARLVVCGDTGVAHLATAYRTPSVVLFGPVSPQHWGPPDDPRHIALWSGRRGDTFADQPDPGLLEITTAAVESAAQVLLESEVRA